MPVNLTIRFDEDQERRLQRELRDMPEELARAQHQAIKRATRTVRSQIARNIARHLFKVRNKDLYDTQRPTNSRRPIRRFFERGDQNRITGSTIQIGGETTQGGIGESVGFGRGLRGRIPLIRFGARQINKGVSYKITKASGRQRIKGAFIATMPTGHEGVFKRFNQTPDNDVLPEGKKRKLPPRIPGRNQMVELLGPSIPHVAQTHSGVQSVINREAGEEYLQELSSQVDRFLERRRRRG